MASILIYLYLLGYLLLILKELNMNLETHTKLYKKAMKKCGLYAKAEMVVLTLMISSWLLAAILADTDYAMWSLYLISASLPIGAFAMAVCHVKADPDSVHIY